MTLSEFKAWLEGFEEGVKGSPNQAQWKKIKERLEMVMESAPYTPQPIIIQRDLPYRPWWPQWYTTSTTWSNTGNVKITCSNAATQIGRLEAGGLED